MRANPDAALRRTPKDTAFRALFEGASPPLLRLLRSLRF